MRSGARPASGKGLGFYALLFTHDTELVALAREAAEPPLELVQATSRAELELQLQTRDVLCAALVDTELGSSLSIELLDLAKRATGYVPAIALLRASTRASIDAASRYADEYAFKNESPSKLSERLRELFVAALEHDLQHAARVIDCGREHALEAAELDTLVALVVRRVPRAELARFFGITDSAVQKRVQGVCTKIGVKRVECLALWFLGLAKRPVRASVVNELRALR